MGGGALLYVKNTLECRQIIWPDDVQTECVGVEITLSAGMSFTLIYLYCHHKVDFFDQLKSILTACDFNKEVILVGDINVHWDNKKLRKNLEQITDYSLIPNHSATRIDLLFSNKVERITKTYNLLTGLSDHNIIFFSRKLSKQCFSKTQPRPMISTVPKNLQPSFEDAL